VVIGQTGHQSHGHLGISSGDNGYPMIQPFTRRRSSCPSRPTQTRANPRQTGRTSPPCSSRRCAKTSPWSQGGSSGATIVRLPIAYSTLFVYRPDHSLLQRRQCKPSFYLVSFLTSTSPQGVGPLGFTQTLFQSLATAAGYDPTVGPGSSCLSNTASGQCVLPWMGGTKSVASVVLIANGTSFAIMTAIFTTIGSAADYGTFGRWLLFTVTVVCWAAQYACMALTCTCRLSVGVDAHSTSSSSRSLETRDGALYRRIRLLRGDVGFLRCCFPPSRSQYPSLSQSTCQVRGRRYFGRGIRKGRIPREE